MVPRPVVLLSVSVILFAIAIALAVAKSLWIGVAIVGIFWLPQIAYLAFAIVAWRRGLFG